MINVVLDGSFVVFRLPHSEETFRLSLAEARSLGHKLVDCASTKEEQR